MSLTTPEKTRTLQRKLYRKAKEKKPPRRGRLRPELFSVCLTMKLVGKPDAGNRHVRFDERGQETECCHMAQATAPVLDSTRREFITLLGGATTSAWPRAARAQQGRLLVVGVLRPSAKDAEPFAEPFRRYMKAIGWEEGRNIRFLFAWMEGRNERAPLLAGDFVAQNVDLIVTFGDPAIRAAQRATQSIPIVGMTDDMVGSGLVASLAG